MNKLKFRPQTPEKHEAFINDIPQGELVYVSEVMSSLERTDNEMIFTTRVPKGVKWLDMAMLLAQECRLLCHWAFELRTRIESFEELPEIERPGYFFGDEDENEDGNEDENEDEYEDRNSLELFMLTHHEGWWEMYEGDENYLLRYRLPKCEHYPLDCRNDLDALEFLPNDESGLLVSFLTTWYYRVNGM